MALTKEPLFMRVNKRIWSHDDILKIINGTDDYLLTLALNHPDPICEEALAQWITTNMDANGVAVRQYRVAYPPIPGVTREKYHYILIMAPTLDAAWWYISQFNNEMPLEVTERVLRHIPIKLLDNVRFQELVEQDLDYI